MKNPYPFLRQNSLLTGNIFWDWLVGKNLLLIDITYIDAFCRGAAPVNGWGNFEVQLEKSQKCNGSNRPWSWRNKAF